MRTMADLESVFSILERRVDEYLDAATAVDFEVEVRPASRRRGRALRPRRRSVLSGFAAAAAVVLLAGGALELFATGAGENQASFGASDDGLPVTSLIFTVNPASGATITDAWIGDGSNKGSSTKGRVQEADLIGPLGHYRVHVSGKGIGLGVSLDGAEIVDVGGHRGYLGCFDGKHSVSDLAACSGGTVAWQYTTGAWVQVFPYGSGYSTSHALAVARVVDFTQTTPARTPVTLSVAPEGMQLDFVDATYRATDPGVAADLPSWGFTVEYRTPGKSDRLLLSVTHGQVSATEVKGAQAVTVLDQQAYWFPYTQHQGDLPNHQLYVDFHGVQVMLDGPATWDLGQFRSVLSTMAVTSNPDDVSTWTEAADALP